MEAGVSSDEVAFAADTRYPSNYKKLKCYTMNWNTRLVFESLARPCMFVTFTYDEDHYLEKRLLNNDVPATLKDDWQKFMKRFRLYCHYHKIPIDEFKYYAITERGDDGRLHFHSLIYGLPFESFTGRNAKGQRVLYVKFNEFTRALDETWQQGFTVYEAAVPENISYVTKYIHKRRISGDYISLKSNGIGLAFLDDAKKKFLKENDQQYYHVGRKKYYLPRYLKKQIWTDEDEYREMNVRLAAKIAEKELAEIDENEQNRYYVVYEDSQELVEKALCRDNLVKYASTTSRETFYLPEIADLIDKSLGFVYDPADDNIRVYLVRQEKSPLIWHRLRQRTNENFKMKTIYNRRL